MKVKQLIEELQELDPEKEVCILNDDTQLYEQIGDISETSRADDCRCCPDVPIVGITSY